MKRAMIFLAVAGLLASTGMAQKGMTRSAWKNQPVAQRLTAAGQAAKPMKGLAAKGGVKAAGNPVWADTMSYCLDGEFATGIGMGSTEATLSWAIKIDAAALVGRNNITDVQIFITDPGTYTMSLYFASAPTGTAAFTQTITATDADTMAWKNIHFATPVSVPTAAANPLWVVFTNTGIPYPAAAVDGATYDNGTYVSLDGATWELLSAYYLDYTWMIRVVSDTYTVQAPMISIDGPAVVLMGQTATFTANSTNSDSYAWYVDGSSESETSNTLTYTFTTDGSHQVVVAGTNTAGITYDTFDVNVVDCSQPISTFPHTEGFESEVPCWTYVSADPANDSRTGVKPVDDAYEGNSVYVLSSYSRATDYNQYLITPELNLTAGTQYAVKFQYRVDDEADYFRVRVSTTTNDTAAFTTLLANVTNLSEDWTELAYLLPDGTKYVAINYYGDYAYYLYIDNFEIGELGAPSVSLAGPASVGSGNVAVFTASANLADSLAWYVDGTFNATTGNVLATTFATTGNHTVVVEAINNIGSAYDTLEVEVFSCDGITIPYAPDFSEGLGCWYNISNETPDMGWYASTEVLDTPIGQVVSFSGASSFLGVFDVPVDNWLTSPLITMPTSGSYEVSWQVLAGGAPDYPGDHYAVYLITADTLLLFEETLTEAESDFAQRVAALPNNLRGTFRIAFRHFNCSGGYAIALDNIELRSLSAAIVTLNGPATVLVNEPATFTAVSSNADSYTWTVDGTAVSETSATLNHTFTTVGSHTVTVTATNSVGSNNASMTVNAIECGITVFPYENGFEDETLNNCWSLFAVDPIDYGFIFNDNPDYAHTGDGCLFGAYSDDVNVDQWAISPSITLPAEATNFTLSWYVKLNEWEGIPSSYEVLVSTASRNASDFTTTLFSESGDNEDYEARSVSLADYAGRTIYIAFHNITAMGGDAMAIDDLRIGSSGVGIDQVGTSVVSVSPNPATGMVTVSAEGVEGRVNVEIVDLNGRTVMQQQGTAASYRFDVSSLAAGAYFVRLVGENTNAVQKLIVK